MRGSIDPQQEWRPIRRGLNDLISRVRVEEPGHQRGGAVIQRRKVSLGNLGEE